MTVRTILVSLAALALALPAAADASTQKIQCWTDKNGQRMCGDNVPPEYAGQRREVFEDGRVVDEVKGAKTPEEIAEEKRKTEAAAEDQRRADYDRALLETYRSAQDIQSMRDERTALIDMRIQAAEKNAADTDKSLENLRGRADALTKEGKPVDDKLARQIRQFERAQKQNGEAMERYKAEREEVVTKFNQDLDRYNQLRGTKPSASAKAKASAPATPAAPAATPAPAPAPATAADTKATDKK